GIVGEDDHLHVRQIRDGVEGRLTQRIGAGQGHEHRREDDKELVLDRPVDELFQHRRPQCLCAPAAGPLAPAAGCVLVIFRMASRRWLSESMGNCADTATRSPAETPPVTAITPSPLTPSSTSRTWNRPPPSAMTTTSRRPLRITASAGTTRTCRAE